MISVKDLIKKVIGIDRVAYYNNIIKLVLNFKSDLFLYYKHSNVFKINNLNKEEAQLVLDYHSIEKGMLFKDMRAGFAQNRIERLHTYLNFDSIIKNVNRSQILVAYQVMCKYYELHVDIGFDISTFYPKDTYEKYKYLLNQHYSKDFQGAIAYSVTDFYQNINASFDTFAHSRKSIRNFTGEKVSIELLNKAVQLALTSPSVCNRQASKVYFLEDKSKIDEALTIQGGFEGYKDNVNQLLILTNDRNFYYTVGERNQFYIDGGIFLMNLLYSLHFHRIANCPANWGKLVNEEKALEKVVNIPESEKIICMIPIGIAEENFRVTLSQRREIEEVLHVI